jgi:hypothetical protein
MPTKKQFLVFLLAAYTQKILLRTIGGTRTTLWETLPHTLQYNDQGHLFPHQKYLTNSQYVDRI